MELSDTKSQDRFSMTDTVNSEDLNDRIQEIIRQHYGQRDSSASARKRSFPRLSSSNKKKLIPQSYIGSTDLDDKHKGSNYKQQKQNADSQSPRNNKLSKSTSKKNKDENSCYKNFGSTSQAVQYSSNNNSLMKYSPSTQAHMIERSDNKQEQEDIDYNNTYANYNYLIENGFSSRKQPFFETSAIHEDQNESDQTIIYAQNNNQRQTKSSNGQNAQHSPAFSKSINSEAGFYKTFNEEDSQIDIKNLIHKLDKKNHTLTNLTNTSYSFLNGGGGSANKPHQNQGRNQKQEQQIISQFSQQNLSEILPNQLFQNFQQQSNLPYILKQQKEYDSNENVNRLSLQTECIKNLENSQLILSETIKKLTIKQLTAIKMMVKPLECVQQLTVCVVSLVKDGRRIMDNFDISRSTQQTEPDDNLEDTPWKGLQEYFVSPGRLMNELSRISDIIEMNQVSASSIAHCKNTINSIQEIKINDNPVLEDQMSILLDYIQAVVNYHDLKQELNRLEQEEELAIKKKNIQAKLKLEQRQKENINNLKQQTQSSMSNYSSKSSKDKQQVGAILSRKQSHDRQSNMTFGQSVCSDTQRRERMILQPKLSASSIANCTNNNNNNNLQQSSSQFNNSLIIKTPIKNKKQDMSRTSSNNPSLQKKLSNSSSSQEILVNSNRVKQLSKRENQSSKTINQSSRRDQSQRSLSKSSSQKLERELRASDLLSNCSVQEINMPKQLEITNTRQVNSSTRIPLQSKVMNTHQNLQSSLNKTNQQQHTKMISPTKKQSNIVGSSAQRNIHKRNGSVQSDAQNKSAAALDKSNQKQKSQSSLMQQSTQSTRSRYSTQISDDQPLHANNLTNNNTRQMSRSNSSRKTGSIFSIQSKKNNLIEQSPSLNNKGKATNNCFDNNSKSLQSSIQNRNNGQRSLSQSSRNSSSQKDLKSRNEAAANIKVSRLDKILNLKVKKPDANSCVKNIINNFDQFSQRTNSIENRSSRGSSQVSKQKLTLQKQIQQEKQDILQINAKKSKLDFYLQRDNKQKIQEAQEMEESMNNKWKLQERERLNGFLVEQKRREKQLIKEMNEESIKCSQISKQIEEWEDNEHQNNQSQQTYINHLYNESQKERQRRDQLDILNYKKLNSTEDRQQKSINSQKSILETSASYQEEDLKRLNNDLKGQQKRKKDLEDTLERTLDVIYNYRKMTCYKQF